MLGSILLPAFIFGFSGTLIWVQMKKPSKLVPVVVAEGLFQTVLFGLILTSSLYLNLTAYPNFLRDTLILAWLVAIVGAGAITLARRLRPETRQRLLYNRGNQIFIDACMLSLAFLMAYLARFDGLPPSRFHGQIVLVLPLVVIFQLGINYLAGVYRFVWRFIGLREMLVISASAALGATLLFLANLAISFQVQRIPFGVVAIYSVLSLGGLLAGRVIRRLQFEWNRRSQNSVPVHQRRRFLLIGAGQSGTLLCRDLEQRSDIQLVGFLDDDLHKKNRTICGLKVLGTTEDVGKIFRQYDFDEVILCMPTAPRAVRRRITLQCETLGLKVSTIPSMSDLVLGKLSISRLKPVRMEDLLGRLSVEYPADDVRLISYYRDRRILVTGAGGSIGSELVRQLCEFSPSRLVLVDKDENSLYEIGLEMDEQTACSVSTFVADIRDRARLMRVFAECRPEVVFHAAAYKHVPLMESNPNEAVLNNVGGSRNLIELAADCQVSSFVLISTDKAVNPTSVMGASKRIAEMLLQRQAVKTPETRFCAVRFGNVLGSRASVVPLFQKRIERGQSLKITHPEVKRYFMTIPEAVQLVIQAGSLGSKGEIFVLDMGDPVKIVDLARELLELSGAGLDRGIGIEFTGLRPGEKLHEELMIQSENGVRNTEYSKIFVASPSGQAWSGLDELVRELMEAARSGQEVHIFDLLEQADIGYKRTVN